MSDIVSIPYALTFDDITMVPQYSNISSRNDPSLETRLTKNTVVKHPFIPSNMDTVINDELADVLIESGSMPIFHRFTSFEQQLLWSRKYNDKCFVSCGLGDFDKTIELLDAGARGCCIDVAHGHCKDMINLIYKLKKDRPSKEVIAGNVCTAMGYHDLVNAGADAVKVHVGNGSVCATRIQTGFGIPCMTAILEIGMVAKRLGVPFISDGGINYSGDAAKAIAAGASTVMMGRQFAGTHESAARKLKTSNGQTYAHYRGQASKEFQEDFRGALKPNTVPEGIAYDLPVTGSALDVINTFSGALRSSFTYGGARSIHEFQRKAVFRRVTPNGMHEALPRPYMDQLTAGSTLQK